MILATFLISQVAGPQMALQLAPVTLGARVQMSGFRNHFRWKLRFLLPSASFLRRAITGAAPDLKWQTLMYSSY